MKWYWVAGGCVIALVGAVAVGWQLKAARVERGEAIRNEALDQERESIRVAFDSIDAQHRARVAADSTVIASHLARDRRQEATADALRDAAAHMAREATTAKDSLTVIPVLESAVTAAHVALDSATQSRDVAIAQRDSAHAATGRLRAQVAVMLTRLDSVSRVRPSLPVEKKQRLLGLFHVKACAFTGVSTNLKPTAGVGVCVS